MRALLVLALLAVPGVAWADASACTKIEEPLAYNACLAREGPKTGAAPAASAPRARSALPTRSPTGVRATAPHRHGGRMEMQFSIGAKG